MDLMSAVKPGGLDWASRPGFLVFYHVIVVFVALALTFVSAR